MIIMAIDPGNIDSAWVQMDSETYRPISFAKEDNGLVRDRVATATCDLVVCEMVASYGMPVGASIFDTCVAIGRFMQIAASRRLPFETLFRREVKLNCCHSVAAKDGNVTQDLIDRFAPGTPNRGKGYKDDPGFFYGFRADIWQAYAVGVTHLDKEREKEHVRQEIYGV